ncbi:hypothetical protein Pcinc_041009 [Petrolisthes cinctipes]|uniref:Uncharacterized protein n=1 Tax=Petrolisthes cinctipes TaxID=88211 RepID=A0AAE1EHE1_PETCI|nr:hypothetical protein Pcinc_041009 [Petrolisthes cinctipes]
MKESEGKEVLFSAPSPQPSRRIRPSCPSLVYKSFIMSCCVVAPSGGVEVGKDMGRGARVLFGERRGWRMNLEKGEREAREMWSGFERDGMNYQSTVSKR